MSSAALPPCFEFADPGVPRSAGAIAARVPRGVRSKQKLLAILADKLHFPGYFGHNWDALEECLRDLSWLQEGRDVAIIHHDLPFGAGGEHRATYVAILASCAQSGANGRKLSVVFPPAAQADVQSLVERLHAGSSAASLRP
jgi:hypothetical protein